MHPTPHLSEICFDLATVITCNTDCEPPHSPSLLRQLLEKQINLDPNDYIACATQTSVEIFNLRTQVLFHKLQFNEHVVQIELISNTKVITCGRLLQVWDNVRPIAQLKLDNKVFSQMLVFGNTIVGLTSFDFDEGDYSNGQDYNPYVVSWNYETNHFVGKGQICVVDFKKIDENRFVTIDTTDVVIWDHKTLEQTLVFTSEDQLHLEGVEILKDGQIALLLGGTITIWDLDSKQQIHQIWISDNLKWFHTIQLLDEDHLLVQRQTEDGFEYQSYNLHSPYECTTFDKWNTTSKPVTVKKGKIVQSFDGKSIKVLDAKSLAILKGFYGSYSVQINSSIV